MWQKASGYLDGSARYAFNDKHRDVARRLEHLDTTAVTQQQVFGDSTLTPGAKAGEARFGLGAQRSALPARRAFQVLSRDGRAARRSGLPRRRPLILATCHQWQHSMPLRIVIVGGGSAGLDVRGRVRAGAASGALLADAHRIG